MKSQNKIKSAANGHGPQKKKTTDSHLPLYCTTDRKDMVLISLKPLKTGHHSKS